MRLAVIQLSPTPSPVVTFVILPAPIEPNNGTCRLVTPPPPAAPRGCRFVDLILLIKEEWGGGESSPNGHHLLCLSPPPHHHHHHHHGLTAQFAVIDDEPSGGHFGKQLDVCGMLATPLEGLDCEWTLHNDDGVNLLRGIFRIV